MRSDLEGLLAAAQRDGYPLRVAIAASRADLGSVGELWRNPQGYAGFLGEELSLLYRGTVLTVMPDGVGIFAARGVPAAQRTAVAGIAVAGGVGIGDAAIAAIRRLAVAAGYHLPTEPAGKLPAPRPQRTDVVAWIAFVFSALMLAGAWTASVRARPLRLRRGAPAAWLAAARRPFSGNRAL